MELFEMTAASLSEKLRKKECSAVEITRSVLEQIEKTEDKIGSFVTVCEEQALKKAEEVDRKIAAGEALSSLAGIPIGVKDNICTKDVLTTCSSKMLYNFVPPYDATVVSRLKQADAVIIGKCNMDEFAMALPVKLLILKRPKTRGIRRMCRAVPPAARSLRQRGGGGSVFGFRHRRLDPSACLLLRCGRSQAHLWIGIPLWFGGVCFFSGSDWSAGPFGRGRGQPVRSDLRPGSDGCDQCSAGIRSVCAENQSVGKRIADWNSERIFRRRSGTGDQSGSLGKC